MRRTALPVLLLVVATSACGTGGHKSLLDSLGPAAAVRQAATHSTSGSSKIELAIETVVAGQDTSLKGSGAFAYSAGNVLGSMSMTVGTTQIDERIVGGSFYLHVPGQPGYFKLALKDLVGTSLAQSGNPGSAAELLAAIGDSVRKVGTQVVRGVRTTHYTGSINVAAASAKLKGVAALAVQKLADTGVTDIPVEAYLDDTGRLRRLTEDLTFTVKTETVHVTTRMDLYDFGTKVDVQAPAAADVHDGSGLLSALKSQYGG